MSGNARRSDFVFDCIVEQPRGSAFGGRFAVIVAFLLVLIALAAAFPARRTPMPQAGEPLCLRVG